MRNLVLRLAVLATMVLTLGACADSPTQSDRAPDLTVPAQGELEVTPQGCVSDGLCVLPPISGGWCEPWMELDWDCDEGGGECEESIGEPADPEAAVGVHSCPGGGDGDNWGGYTPPPGGTGPGDPGTICIQSYTEPCTPEEEEYSDICPQPILGKVATALVPIAGRNHEFGLRRGIEFHVRRLARMTGGWRRAGTSNSSAGAGT